MGSMIFINKSNFQDVVGLQLRNSSDNGQSFQLLLLLGRWSPTNPSWVPGFTCVHNIHICKSQRDSGIPGSTNLGGGKRGKLSKYEQEIKQSDGRKLFVFHTRLTVEPKKFLINTGNLGSKQRVLPHPGWIAPTRQGPEGN